MNDRSKLMELWGIFLVAALATLAGCLIGGCSSSPEPEVAPCAFQVGDDVVSNLPGNKIEGRIVNIMWWRGEWVCVVKHVDEFGQLQRSWLSEDELDLNGSAESEKIC